MRRREITAGYLFVAPMVIGLGLFSFYAFFKNIYLSFTYSKFFMPAEFVGLQNYKNLLMDEKFLAALRNTIVYVIAVVPIGVCISVIVAALLNADIKGKGIFRTMIFFPLVTTSAAISMTWRWIFNTRYGLMNSLIQSLGGEPVKWLTSPEMVQITCIIVIIWSMIGYNVIILLAGLQQIPKVYYEAARIDGASRIKQFFNVTLPLLSPSLYFVITLSVIGVFKQFAIVYMLVPGSEFYTYSPEIAASTTLVRFYFDVGIKGGVEVGYAAASSIFLFIIILIVTIIMNRTQHKWVHYAYRRDKA